jgi:polysaccharide export outer membrane protein
MKQTYSLFFLTVLILFASCKSYEKVIYLQQAGTSAVFSADEQYPMPEPVIREGDLLVITINTNTPEAAIPFNLPLVPGNTATSYSMRGSNNLSYGLGLQNYLVDAQGMLTFPVIGTLKVAGLTKTQLAEALRKKMYPQYLNEDPIVLIRFGNFRVSVLGEVNRPGTYPIDNERVSILEALALAGDMTIYGNRANVLLVRESNGLRESVRIDLRDKNLINSPYFYMQQNDVLYIEPNAPRQRSSGISTAETISISIVGTLISLTTLLINILK